MEKEDAFSLYDDIYKKYGRIQKIHISKKPIVFDRGMYKDDNNGLEAWGYNGKSKKWKQFEEIANNYVCNFSLCPHTTIQYSKFLQHLTPTLLYSDMCTNCTLEVADITSDDPSKWKIITKK